MRALLSVVSLALICLNACSPMVAPAPNSSGSLASGATSQVSLSSNLSGSTISRIQSGSISSPDVVSQTGILDRSALETKWASAELGKWPEYRNITNAAALILPADSDRFTLITPPTPAPQGYEEELGTYWGMLHAPFPPQDAGSGALYGNATISYVTILQEPLRLSDWVASTSKAIHEDYCKKYGTSDIRSEGGSSNAECPQTLNIMKTFSNVSGETLLEEVVWNNGFIGEPQIVSVKIPGTILNFKLSQEDQSENFKTFVEDIAKTLN